MVPNYRFIILPVFQQLTMALILFSGYYLFNKTRIYKIRFSVESFKKLFSFGGYLLLATIISRVSDNIYALLIGRYYTMGDVGYFNRAQSLQNLPIVTINRSISDASTPKLYQMQDDVEGLVKSTRKILRLLNFLTFPLIAGMYIFSKEIVILLLTVKWIAIIPFFKIFLIASLFYSHNYFSQMIFKAIGKTNIFFRVELLSKLLLILLVIIAIKINIIALAWCSVLVGLTLFFLNMYFLSKTVGYNYKNVFQDYKYAISTTILMVVLLLTLNKFFNFDYVFLDVFIKSLLGIIFYFTINIFLKNEISLLLRDKLKILLNKK